MCLLAPFSRPLDRLGPGAEEGHEGAVGPPEHLRPEVGDSPWAHVAAGVRLLPAIISGVTPADGPALQC